MLASDPQQLLVPANLPDEGLRALCARHHLGDEMHYDITSEEEVERSMRQAEADRQHALYYRPDYLPLQMSAWEMPS